MNERLCRACGESFDARDVAELMRHAQHESAVGEASEPD
jgi:hypothetical protein